MPRIQILATTCVLAFCMGGPLPLFGQPNKIVVPAPKSAQPKNVDDKNPFDGDAAFDYMKRIVELGPRVSGSKAMVKQREMLAKHFREDLGAEVKELWWNYPYPRNPRRSVKLANLWISFHPDRPRRILICTHYDTRPFANKDPKKPRREGLFLGANDGASGVGLLTELGRHVKDLEGDLGVDFVFFDAEEYIFDKRRDKLFVGSTHFANMYSDKKRGLKFHYESAILLDMIGDKHLDLFLEKNSMQGDSEKITRGIWDTAQRLGVKEFVPKIKHEIRDDHLPLINIAGIPSCDIIDFDYPTVEAKDNKTDYWHTLEDTVDKCSAESLAKVGWVVLEYIKSQSKSK